MSPTQLTHPAWLPATAGVLLAALLALAFAGMRAERRRRVLLGPAAQTPLRGLAGDLALLAALVALAIALLGPRVGERLVAVPASGIDAVFVVDVSRSMDARDTPPSRLARARRALEELLGRLAPGDRAALVAFAGRGALLAPLTPDTQVLLELAASLDSELIRPAHSDLAAGLRAGLETFEYASERPRSIFVLSDGETSPVRAALGVAADAARRQVRILGAAFGSDLGAEVPDHGAALRDPTGRVVVSRRRSERLAELVAAAEGELFVADEWGSFDFAAAAASLRRDARNQGGDVVLRRVPAAWVAPFAGIAFALLLGELLSAPGLRRDGLRIREWLRVRAPLALALVLPFALGAQPGAPAGDAAREIEARLQERPRDARLLIELGVARLARGQGPEALRAFRAAAAYAREPALAALAYYDAGVAALDLGALETARDAFFDALALAPRDRRARFNLEWTLEALATLPPAPATPDPPRPWQPPANDEGESAREEQPEPSPAPGAARPPSLDESALRRALEQLEDDPARAVRRSLRGEPRPRRHAEEPAW